MRGIPCLGTQSIGRSYPQSLGHCNKYECDPTKKEGAHGEVDHGFGDVEALLVVSDQASPADHPAEGRSHALIPHYAGFDLSDRETAIHVADGGGKTVWRGKRPREPEALAAALRRPALELEDAGRLAIAHPAEHPSLTNLADWLCEQLRPDNRV